MNRTKVAEIAYEAWRAYDTSAGGATLAWGKLSPIDRDAIGQAALAVHRGTAPMAGKGATDRERVAEAIFAAVVRAARGLGE